MATQMKRAMKLLPLVNQGRIPRTTPFWSRRNENLYHVCAPSINLLRHFANWCVCENMQTV